MWDAYRHLLESTVIAVDKFSCGTLPQPSVFAMQAAPHNLSTSRRGVKCESEKKGPLKGGFSLARKAALPESEMAFLVVFVFFSAGHNLP